MRLGKWTLALAALLIMGGTAMAQIDANRICLNNGSEYYISGYDHNVLNNGVGKYYPSFVHWGYTESTTTPDTWPWKIRGWAWSGMQAVNNGPLWRWGTVLHASVDSPWATTMSWDYPLNYCTAITPHTGAPQPIYGNHIAMSTVFPTLFQGREFIHPSSLGGVDAYQNIFALADFTFNIPSTAAYYGWSFAATIPAASAIEVPSNVSIYEYAFENFGPYGQYGLASGDELDCTATPGVGGNKGRNYMVLNIGDTGYFGYFNNSCNGGKFEWDMCLFVDDCVTIPTNYQGASAVGPFAAYGFDVGSGTVTPAVQTGACNLQFMAEDYANPGAVRVLLCDSPWVGYAPYGTPAAALPFGKLGYRLPHQFSLVCDTFIKLAGIWAAPMTPGYPGCMFGSTVGGNSIALPIPPDPAFKCFELRWSSISYTKIPSASFMTCWF